MKKENIAKELLDKNYFEWSNQRYCENKTYQLCMDMHINIY